MNKQIPPPRTSEWDNLKNVKFEGSGLSAKTERGIDQAVRRSEYVDHAIKSQTLNEGLRSGDNADKLTKLREAVEASYHMGTAKEDDEHHKQLDKLDGKIIRDGKEKMLDGKESNSEASIRTVTEVLAKTEFDAQEFSKERVSIDAARDVFNSERFNYNSLLNRYQDYKSGKFEEPKGFFAKRNYHKRIEEIRHELNRYGYNDGRSKSSEAKEYEEHMIGGSEMLSMAKQRAEDFSTLQTLSKGKYGRRVKKALKRHGFNELPQAWNEKPGPKNDNLTTYEISQMAQIAKTTINSLQHHQKT